MRRGASLTGSVSSALACGIAALGLAGCGAGSRPATAATSGTSASASGTTTTVTTTATITTTTTTTATTTVTLPGAGRPPVTIGDENTPEQFLLGQLYYQALKAQGFSVALNQSIGPPEVIQQAMANGQLAMYPEYLDTWDSSVAGIERSFRSRRDAYLAGQHYALKHGLALLNPTPFSDTNAIAVTFDYAVENNVQSISDLLSLAPQLTLGGPPQFQQSPTGLPAIEQVYGVTPAAFKPLELGAQYQALDSGDSASRRRLDDRSPTAERRLPAAGGSAEHVRLGQRRPGGVGSRARRRGTGVRGHDQPRQRAAHAADDARAERGGGDRRSGPGRGRDPVPSGRGRAPPALDHHPDLEFDVNLGLAAAAGAEASRSPLGQRELVDLDDLGRLDPDQHQLGDPLAALRR